MQFVALAAGSDVKGNGKGEKDGRTRLDSTKASPPRKHVILRLNSVALVGSLVRRGDVMLPVSSLPSLRHFGGGNLLIAVPGMALTARVVVVKECHHLSTWPLSQLSTESTCPRRPLGRAFGCIVVATVFFFGRSTRSGHAGTSQSHRSRVSKISLSLSLSPHLPRLCVATPRLLSVSCGAFSCTSLALQLHPPAAVACCMSPSLRDSLAPLLSCGCCFCDCDRVFVPYRLCRASDGRTDGPPASCRRTKTTTTSSGAF